MPNPSKGEREALIIRVPVGTLDRLRSAAPSGGRNEFIVQAIDAALVTRRFATEGAPDG